MNIVLATLLLLFFSSTGAEDDDPAADVGFQAFRTGVLGIESGEASDWGRLGVRAGDEVPELLDEPRIESRARVWF